jgi:hypothetical protein
VKEGRFKGEVGMVKKKGRSSGRKVRVRGERERRKRKGGEIGKKIGGVRREK